MKKIVIGFFVLTLLVSTTVFAERGRGGRDDSERSATSTRSELRVKMKNATSTKALKNVDTTCVSEAVLKREDAIMSAWATFNTEVTSILTDRKAALVSAWAISDAKERRAAVKEAWATAKKERKTIANEYKIAKKKAWAEFKKEAKACGGSDGMDASGESESGEKIEI